ncbi:MAG: hypothetical protein M0000_04090 [Actinomycetota bacterium]|nr:hypothetical protein [Actinomycetota bacterium]
MSLAHLPEELQRFMVLWQELAGLNDEGLAAERHSAAVACAWHVLEESRLLATELRGGGQVAVANELGMCLIALAEAPWDEVGEGAKAWWIATALDVAGEVGEDDVRERLTAVAIAAAEPGQAAGEAAAYGGLIRSRSSFQRGNGFLATVAARDLIADPSVGLDVRSTALEIVARAARNARNPVGEKNALADWWALFADVPGGPVQYAGRYMLQQEDGKAPRGEEMLGAASRLIELWKHENPDGALAVCDSFITANLLDWQDPEEPTLGTMRERAERLAAPRRGAERSEDEAHRLVVIEVERAYDRISEASWINMLTAVSAAGPDAWRLILLSLEKVNGNEFSIGTSGLPVSDLFASTAMEVAAEEDWAALELRFWTGVEEALGPRTGRAWVVVEHGGHEPEVSDLVFAVRPALVAGALQLSVYSGLVVEPDQVPPGRGILDRLNHGDLERLPGFAPLRNASVEVFIETGHRLESHAIAKKPGPVKCIS